MRQLTIISGKGGTGKTTIAAAFASLAKNAVLADCDVDASNLHLILNPRILETHDFLGMKTAYIDKSKCTFCGKCREMCRFEAITDAIEIERFSCEGCGVCAYICPEKAIELVERKSGEAYISKTRFGPMAHARLGIAQEASGKLVTIVRNNARLLAEQFGKELIIIDGPPGIGCPVIASISGVDLVLAVTEPTPSGIHDLERILDVADHFKIKAAVCINKYDVNEEAASDIESYCEEREVPVVARIPYDDIVTKAMIAGKTVIEFSKDKISREIRQMWSLIEGMMKID
jgi:MinD superfamily P-loop ATPase